MTAALPKKVALRREHTGTASGDRAQLLAQRVAQAHEQTKAYASSIDGRVTKLEAFGPNPRWRAAKNGAALAVANTAGNFTTGVQFSVGEACSCVGVRFYAVVAAGKTVKVSLWNAAGTRLQTATATVSSTGVVEVALPATALTPFALYRVTTWQTDGLNYYAYVAANANAPVRPFYAGGAVVLNNIALFLGGDVAPTNTAAGEAYPVEPILF